MVCTLLFLPHDAMLSAVYSSIVLGSVDAVLKFRISCKKCEILVDKVLMFTLCADWLS